MKSNSRRVAVAVFAAVAMVAACRETDVSHTVTVTIPPTVPAMSSGVLRLRLHAYDPRVGDGPATLIDMDSVRFSHAAGRASVFRMRVGGIAPAGYKPYLTVRGYDLTAACERYVLWDGTEGLGLPGAVVMRTVPQPGCLP